MKKNEKQPKTALGAVVVEMSQNLNSDATQAQEETKTQEEPKTKTIEEVLQENERLRKQLERQPKTLQEKIDFFKMKEEHIKQLGKIDKKRESIFTAFELVTEDAEKDEFFSETFSLNLTHKSNMYGKEDEIFKLNNPVVIGEVLQFAIARLDIKREELQFLIEA